MEVPGLVGVTQIAASGTLACAVLDGGAVSCWGANDQGQVGDGTTIERHRPTAVTGLSAATGVAITSSPYAGFACAPRLDGTVWCWGNPCPPRGNGTAWCWDDPATMHARPVAIQALRDVAQVVVTSYWGLCVRTRDGRVRCGRSEWYDVAVEGARALVAGRVHACALLTDRTVRCWGDNTWNQLGDVPLTWLRGNEAPSLMPAGPPVDPGLRDVVQLAAGTNHTCALTADRTVWCWGHNSYGMLGIGGVEGVPCGGTGRCLGIPDRVLELHDVVRIAVGGGTSCAIRADGTLWCWGWPTDVPGSYTRIDGSEGVIARPVLVRWR